MYLPLEVVSVNGFITYGTLPPFTLTLEAEEGRNDSVVDQDTITIVHVFTMYVRMRVTC